MWRGERFAQVEHDGVRRFAPPGASKATTKRRFAQLLEDKALGVGDWRIGWESDFDQLRPIVADG